MEPVKVAKVIHIEKGKAVDIKVFKFRFQKLFAEKMERWCCTNKKCKCYIKCNESREIFRGGGDFMRNNNVAGKALSIIKTTDF